ncbi:MAG: hypothetical protein K8I03_06705 [Ignavibacteria bacterium]|nr:hypothetical protein [Ignavibacteria bacterium]
MKKNYCILTISLIIFFVFQTKVSAQSDPMWEIISGTNDIHNTNSGEVFVNSSLRWNNGSSYLSNDQGGSIELGYPFHHNCTPYIDFHIGGGLEDFNMRIMNSSSNKLDFMNSYGAKLTFDGNPSGLYNLPSLRLYNPVYEGNSFQFQNANGLAAIDFWNFGGTNGVLDFYADYENHPEYCQFSIKSDGSCGWANDWSALSNDQGGSIHLNKYGLDDESRPFIDFSRGRSFQSNHIDVRIKNTDPNTLDFLTNMDIQGNGGSKIMSIKNDGVYATKLTVQASWSDFVFASDYHLLSLSELESYINENGHLPDIPTESFVSENGIEIGEMTSKLLQKIEEMSLYLIDLNKQVETLKKENADMKSLINK